MFTNYKEKKYKNEIHIYSYLFLEYIYNATVEIGVYILSQWKDSMK